MHEKNANFIYVSKARDRSDTLISKDQAQKFEGIFKEKTLKVIYDLYRLITSYTI